MSSAWIPLYKNSVGGTSFYILIKLCLTIVKLALAFSPVLSITMVRCGLSGRMLRDIVWHLVAVL